MGWLSWLQSSKVNKVSSKDKAVLDLKLQRDKVKQYQKRLSLIGDRERELAKQSLAKGNKQRALLFLRKQKFQNQLLEKSFSQLSNLEELIESIEFAQVQQEVVKGLEQGAQTLKAINAEMSLDKIDKIMDDTAEGIAYQREIEQTLSSAISDEDELAIERDLERMEKEMMPETAASKDALKEQQSADIVNELPEVPKTVPQPAAEPVEPVEENAEEQEPVLA
ncbi:ESCRT-III subunit protein [Starmerella bacillaris]|uniref:ESCRT-III subunit protein n=1 Tax=Starmerella bacillaris TaxID=1247836 RepID=A0AAV5RF84_STABA|nr:ESCRT-III subunit protein [Starmerella bacillaris]